MFKKFTPYIYISALIAAFIGGFTTSQWKLGNDERIRLEAQIEAQRRIDNALYDISMQTQEAIANIRIENRNIYNETRTEILEKPIYNECIIPIEGVNLINRARVGE